MEQELSFAISLYAMPCTNHCAHCWAEGSPKHRAVPVEQVYFVLEKLAEVKRYPAEAHVTLYETPILFYDEPSIHPQFIEIIERATELGLIPENFFMATNGSGLARAPDEVWQRMKQAGANCLQLTVYGLEETHDRFAGRRGAFQDIVTTIQRAQEHGVKWYGGLVIHPGNLSEVAEATAYFGNLGGDFFFPFTFSWQGRGRKAPRPRGKDLPRRPDGKPLLGGDWVEEREGVRRILADPELASRPAVEPCTGLVFQVDRDLRVFCGCGCDAGGLASAIPERREDFFLGKLDQDGFLPMIDSYRQHPPRPIALLDGVTWGELAERHGDRENDEIYWLNDLPQHKWAAAYLQEKMGGEENRA